MIEPPQIEKVYVENDYYDGPRAGVADVNGIPHRFVSNFDRDAGDWSDTFTLFPIGPDMLGLEREQWRLFVAWNRRYESGEVGVQTHPGHGGIDPRWDALEALLVESRRSIPTGARQAHAEFVRNDREERYSEEGPCYSVQWTLL